ncbi:flavin-containing monooxygenase FMO GS-OX-like 4 isoform X2 [Prosopis cineraria]|uniref:flavin-containing monooxygenase FMO GS-OX-like 4 isoform X2 n=1 Tax=Prosopis cineraria TaxID=364024 RepID=UPI00240F2FF5|nr:flavin-containing monooxygenase FMO GS-OX-like 4 isoform X2 [Prosopis cineraria]
MVQSATVAVIGAGVAGLCAARELLREGHTVVVFEKSDQIGGTWKYDPRTESDPLGIDPTREVVHSSLYLSLRTNLPRPLMGFLDYPFPENRENGDPRTFPGHEEVLWFLNKFADDFGIGELIRFNREVLRIERVDARNDKWVIQSKSRGGDSLFQDFFQAVVVCSGHFTEPRIAKIPGVEKWSGNQIHSHNYRVPEPFRDQSVVVIGFGPSAFDISRDIAKVAKEVHIATRSTNVKAMKLAYHDNIWQHTMVRCVSEDGMIMFEDGSSVSADVIFYCTGYKYHYPFLETNGIVTIDDNRVGPLYKHVFPPALAPWLSFIGIPEKSKWVARVLSGKVPIPTEKEMMKYVEEYCQQMEKNGIPKHFTHYLHFKEVGYSKWLAEEAGLPPVDEWREKMYVESITKISNMEDNYRDQWDDAYWETIIKGESSH